MPAATNLFRTIAEMQTYYPFDGNMEFWELQTHLGLVEQKYLVEDLLGTLTWDALMLAIGENSYPPGGDWEKLRDLCRAPAAKLTALYHIPETNVKYTGAGLLITRSEKAAPASEFRTKDLKLALQSDTQDLLNTLVRYLESNTAVFTDWADSEQRASRSALFPEAKTFSTYYHIADNHWIFRKLQAFITDVEDNHLTQLLGAEYLTELRTELLTGTVSADNAAALKYIRPFVANMTMVQAIPRLSIDMSPRGIILFHNERSGNDETYQAADGNRIEMLINKANTMALSQKSDISSFLNTNASDMKYTTYKNGPAYRDPEIDINDFGNDPDDDERNGYYAG